MISNTHQNQAIPKERFNLETAVSRFNVPAPVRYFIKGSLDLIHKIEHLARGLFSCWIPLRELKTDFDEAQKVKVVIIGSGPAGYTAAIYAARANLEPVIFEGSSFETSGGQLMSTTEVENYPGFPEGVDGPQLIMDMQKQAKRFGAVMLEEDVKEVDFSKYPYIIKGDKHSYKALSVIVATGAKANRLDIPGTREGEFWQRGVSACAVCDGALPLFRNKPVYVIGGGDSAVEEALFLAKFASKVFIVHRRDKLRASKIMQQRIFTHPKIEVIWNSAMTKVEGEKIVQRVMIKNLKTNQESSQEAAGVFFATGHTPNTTVFKKYLQLDNHGYIKTQAGTSRTNLPMVYAAGDVKDPIYRQAITAAASGCMAALDAEKDLAHSN